MTNLYSLSYLLPFLFFCICIYLNRNNDEAYVNFNWDKLGFGLTPTDYIYIMKISGKDNFSEGSLSHYGNIEISPSAAIFNYGQGLFEGLKAYRRPDGGIQLFRPELNALRMKNGADRLCMPSPPVDVFVDAVKKTVLANQRWVPPPGKGSLYIRPLLMGSGPVLGIGPAPECTFLIFTSPIGNWYKCGPSMNLYVENEVPRATPGGTGAIKSITNYSPVFEAVNKAKAKGFTDVLFLDAATGKNVEEVSSCNVFIMKDNVILTPPTNGTILPGVTRKSIIEIALHLKYKVEERDVPLVDVLTADEVFCTGTAVGVTAVASVTDHDKRVEYRTGEKSVSQKLRVMLTEIQTGVVEDKMGWTMQIH
ncbi:branched-chain-amino-acid aminotransferase 6-like [Pyrus communis]|uniref:branched-chain-amino-acid aminotransferase 6-like n=1 Tax=Pyrus communis TaxID=23211 RepID=UPI0035BF625D